MTKATGRRHPPTRDEVPNGNPGQKAGWTTRATRVFDADGKILGRLSTEIATSLRGKDRPTWVPYRDDGAVVVVTNTDSVRISGTKRTSKLYRRHTQRKPGAWSERTFAQRISKDSREIVREAVWNMLPKNRLRHRMITRLRLFRGQSPENLEL